MTNSNVISKRIKDLRITLKPQYVRQHGYHSWLDIVNFCAELQKQLRINFIKIERETYTLPYITLPYVSLPRYERQTGTFTKAPSTHGM